MVDCGGGTVDITVHEMASKDGHLRELFKATGGPYGSISECANIQKHDRECLEHGISRLGTSLKYVRKTFGTLNLLPPINTTPTAFPSMRIIAYASWRPLTIFTP